MRTRTITIGERERPELFQFDLIRRADMMAEVAAFWVARTSRPKLRSVSRTREEKRRMLSIVVACYVASIVFFLVDLRATNARKEPSE